MDAYTWTLVDSFQFVFLPDHRIRKFLLDTDFTNLPLFLQLRYVNVHVVTVFSVTRTLGDTRGQTAVVRSSGSGQFAGPVESISLALGRTGLSHRHIQVGVGTDDMATSDADNERHLVCARHNYLHHESTVHTFPPRLRSPAPDAGRKGVHIHLCQDKARVVVLVFQLPRPSHWHRGIQHRR